MQSKSKGYILVIDDEEAIRESFKGFLEDSGYLVITADNGKSGLDQFYKEIPKLVLVDLRMPEVNGHDVISKISETHPNCPIIVVSGTGVVEDAIEAVHHGAWDYITKPVNDFSVLMHSIDKSLEKAHLRVENENYKNRLEKLVEEKTSELKETHEKLKLQYDELKLAKEKAEENDKLKTAFLANVSHEIRTPMNGILGFTELLRDVDLTEENKNEYINLINDSGKRMLNILNDLIDISKIEAGQVDITVESCNINTMLDNLYGFFKPQADLKDIKLELIKSSPDEEVTILTDQIKLYQVLSNVLKNAVKFTDDGIVEFGYKIIDTTVQFFVSDTGIGIKPDAKGKIFSRFVQADNDYTKSYEGAGLGLSISKAYIEVLGGNVDYKTELEKGTTFYISHPFRKAFQEKSDLKVANTDEKLPEGKVILIAEDDNIARQYFSQVINRKDLQLLFAKDGKEAVEFVKDISRINLVLMDIKMPKMNGLDATREIKKIRPDLPIIIQTAYPMPEQKKRAEQAGCDNFILKPIKRSELFKLINKYLADTPKE